VAPFVLDALAGAGVHGGFVVDLGCGSGPLAAALVRAGHRVLGLDLSPAMVALARRRVPRAEFRVASLHRASLPRCDAVVSVGECLNYAFDPRGACASLLPLFRRVHRALRPGGLLVFDLAGPGQVPEGAPVRGFREGRGWAVLFEKEEDPRRRTLVRRGASSPSAGRAGAGAATPRSTSSASTAPPTRRGISGRRASGSG
jgi:SAM-dependent methyltransferase